MMPAPKGLKYWISDSSGTRLSNDAPEWVKREFQEYMNEMKAGVTKDGKVIKL